MFLSVSASVCCVNNIFEVRVFELQSLKECMTSQRDVIVTGLKKQTMVFCVKTCTAFVNSVFLYIVNTLF